MSFSLHSRLAISYGRTGDTKTLDRTRGKEEEVHHVVQNEQSPAHRMEVAGGPVLAVVQVVVQAGRTPLQVVALSAEHCSSFAVNEWSYDKIDECINVTY